MNKKESFRRLLKGNFKINTHGFTVHNILKPQQLTASPIVCQMLLLLMLVMVIEICYLYRGSIFISRL
jgi:hypothetical protein